MAKRNKTEQLLSILDACQNQPMKLTHIMYRTNLNCSLLKEYITDMINKDLLTVKTVGERAFFRTTKKGFVLLKNWRQIRTSLVV